MASKQKLEEIDQGMAQIQLATRVPKDLFKTVKVFCVQTDVSVSDFTTDALRHELESRKTELAQTKKMKPATKPVKQVKVKKKVIEDYEGDDENAA